MKNMQDHAHQTEPGSLGKLLFSDRKVQAFDEKRITAAVPCTIRKKFSRDEFIFFQGEEAESLFLIVSGRVKVVNQSAEGKEITLAILGKDEIFGEMALLDGRSRSASVVALTATEAIALNQWHFSHLLDDCPEFFLKITRIFIERLRNANRRIEHLALCSVRDRLICFLTDVAEHAQPGEASFPLIYTHQEIADLIGASRESVTRAFRSLIDEGIIAPGSERRNYILNGHFA